MRHILKLACTDHSRYACIAYSAWITSPLLGCPCPWIIFSCDIDFSSLLPWEGPKTPLTDVAGCVSSHEVSRGVNCFFDSRILFLGCRQTTEAQGRRALGISAIMFRSKRKDSAIRVSQHLFSYSDNKSKEY
nr:hypothetical protein BgiMline_006972 [Biomphalaria glabrata]